jgi:hypothetical protein
MDGYRECVVLCPPYCSLCRTKRINKRQITQKNEKFILLEIIIETTVVGQNFVIQHWLRIE